MTEDIQTEETPASWEDVLGQEVRFIAFNIDNPNPPRIVIDTKFGQRLKDLSTGEQYNDLKNYEKGQQSQAIPTEIIISPSLEESDKTVHLDFRFWKQGYFEDLKGATNTLEISEVKRKYSL